MAKALMVNAGDGILLANSLTRYLACANVGAVAEKTKANAQIIYHLAGIISNLSVRVIDNTIDMNSIIRQRKNGAVATDPASAANGLQVVTIIGFSTGLFEDTTNTDTIADSNDTKYSVLTGDIGDVPGNLTFTEISVVFAATTGTVVRHAAVGFPDISNGSTYYNPIAGLITEATTDEAGVKTDINAAGTIENLQAYVSSNLGALATSVFVRQNGANAGSPGNLTVSCTGLTTGNFEDITNVITIAANDDVNTSVVSQLQAAFVLEIVAMDYITSSKRFHSINGKSHGDGIQSFNLTKFLPIGGSSKLGRVTEVGAKAEMNIAATGSNLVVNVPTNTILS